mmetsp:Transcript_5826/g.11185  ORF Transcript_5826/g.11185 Transcript_5826/m.11185 type:complete len:386 (-) Transcript_5826:9-1166(-)
MSSSEEACIKRYQNYPPGCWRSLWPEAMERCANEFRPPALPQDITSIAVLLQNAVVVEANKLQIERQSRMETLELKFDRIEAKVDGLSDFLAELQQQCNEITAKLAPLMANYFPCDASGLGETMQSTTMAAEQFRDEQHKQPQDCHEHATNLEQRSSERSLSGSSSERDDKQGPQLLGGTLGTSEVRQSCTPCLDVSEHPGDDDVPDMMARTSGTSVQNDSVEELDCAAECGGPTNNSDKLDYDHFTDGSEPKHEGSMFLDDDVADQACRLSQSLGKLSRNQKRKLAKAKAKHGDLATHAIHSGQPEKQNDSSALEISQQPWRRSEGSNWAATCPELESQNSGARPHQLCDQVPVGQERGAWTVCCEPAGTEHMLTISREEMSAL